MEGSPLRLPQQARVLTQHIFVMASGMPMAWHVGVSQTARPRASLLSWWWCLQRQGAGGKSSLQWS